MCLKGHFEIWECVFQLELQKKHYFFFFLRTETNPIFYLIIH